MGRDRALDDAALVALPRGPRAVLSYAAPLELPIELGRRVLVPLGRSNKRVTGYVVGFAPAPADVRLKPVAEVLDPAPLFDAHMLSLFEFIASYYVCPLGDVIRGGLPGGLNVVDSRVATLTAAGGEARDGHPVLQRLSADKPTPVKELKLPPGRLMRLCEQGLLTLSYALERPRVAARYASVVSASASELPAALRPGGAPARVFERLLADGPTEGDALREHEPNAAAALRRLVELGAVRIEKRQVYRDPWRGEAPARDTAPTLSPTQLAAVDAITGSAGYTGFLLYGITGSGKTEVYLESLRRVLATGRSGLVLVPEIALTPQLAGRFRARFGDAVAVLHSGLSDGERLDQWEQIRSKRLRIVVGARSALFAPLTELGLIVVDEEHETSFKQDEAPRYHARDLALYRGRLSGCPVVLGSATPSLESWTNAERGRLTRLELPGRVMGRDLPGVELVDVSHEAYVWPEALITAPLERALRETLARREQAILFLNRRGYAASFQCAACQLVLECPDCSVAMTFHRARRRVVCHCCGREGRLPERCPKCLSLLIEHRGVGTEQVEAVLMANLPTARVARMDHDTTRGEQLTQLLDAFRAHEIDILVGTQMVAKGHDFPKVTLVGVLQAEQALGIPDFRAAERTFQLITQVAGRAGRHEAPGRVLVQTSVPQHYALVASGTHDYLRFVAEEARRRRGLGNPPFGFLVLLRIDAQVAEQASATAGALARAARTLGQAHGVVVVGPHAAPVERVRGRTRWQVLLRARDRAALHQVVEGLAEPLAALTGDVRASLDVDPQNLS